MADARRTRAFTLVSLGRCVVEPSAWRCLRRRGRARPAGPARSRTGRRRCSARARRRPRSPAGAQSRTSVGDEASMSSFVRACVAVWLEARRRDRFRHRPGCGSCLSRAGDLFGRADLPCGRCETGRLALRSSQMAPLSAVGRALRTHCFASDALLALALMAVVQLEIWLTNVTVPKGVAAPAGVLMTLPLAWRRRAPLAVTIVVMGSWTAQSLLDYSSQPPQIALLAVLLALFSVAAQSERRRAVAGGAVTLVALLASAPGDAPVLGPLVVGVWLAGRLLHERQRLAAALRDRTSALEREQDESARLAIAEERARIARELHDVVAHSVSVMVVQAGAERLSLGGGQGG